MVDERQQLDRLLKLYLTGGFSEAVLAENRARLETSIQRLEQERAGLSAQLESQTLSDEQVFSIVGFAEQVGSGLEKADEDFKARRHIIELLERG